MGIGIEDLERLNALPKEISKPDMDLEKLKRLPEYRRRQWWDELLRVEEEYYGKYYLGGETNEYLEANIAMSKLKLIVSFSDKGEQCPVHSFKEDEMTFMRGFEELVVIGRLSVDELVDYFKRVKGKERGLVKIAFDAVNQGYSVMDEIVRRGDIPGDLANAFKRVYGERLKKMEETAKKYIDKYGLPAVEDDVTPSAEEKIRKEKKKDDFHSYIRDNILRKEKESLPSWDDIGGLENVKELIKKSVVIGIIENKPKAIEAWNTILFYGPPGTGKTLMAAAVAKNIDATFFDVKVSQMLSKHYGESPKIMSALFEVAREEAPSVVFIDEFDSIALSRGTDIDEETRRGLSTLLAELDGLGSKTAEKKLVLVIAATNTPEAIDEAIMSRFGKKIEIPLPDFEACKEILKIQTEKKGVRLEDDSLYDKLARYCVEHKMSGRNIRFLCTEAIGKMLDEMNPNLERLAEEPYENIREYELKVRSLKEEDFELG